MRLSEIFRVVLTQEDRINELKYALRDLINAVDLDISRTGRIDDAVNRNVDRALREATAIYTKSGVGANEPEGTDSGS